MEEYLWNILSISLIFSGFAQIPIIARQNRTNFQSNMGYCLTSTLSRPTTTSFDPYSKGLVFLVQK
jgi:hypothetical protein